MAIENLPPSGALITEFQSLLDAIADAIVVLDDDGRVRFANHGAVELFDDEKGLVGEEFGHPVSSSHVSELEIVGSTTTRYVGMRATPLELGGERYTVVALTEVTERVRAERRFRAAIRLREELLRVTAHEIRMPLTVVSGMALTLQRSWDSLDDIERQHMVSRISTRAEELHQLTDQLLSSSPADRWGAQPTAVEVRALAERAAEPFPDIDLDLRADPGITLWCDAGHLVEILTNLFSNAAKYGRGPVEVSATDRGTRVRIVVRDHGPGVPEESVGSLFTAGWRAEATAATVEGTGLGLGIVAKLADANDGAVWYEPAADGGSRFVVEMPARRPQDDDPVRVRGADTASVRGDEAPG